MKNQITFNGLTKRDNNWECFAWTVNINGEIFFYYTGIGHCTKATHPIAKPKGVENKKCLRFDLKDQTVYVHVPKIKDVLYSLARDAQVGSESFYEFCSNFGYDEDSRKALDIYMQCQQTEKRLRKVLKSKNAIQRILEWEL